MRRRIDVMTDIKKFEDDKIAIDHQINDLKEELETLPVDMHEEFAAKSK